MGTKSSERTPTGWLLGFSKLVDGWALRNSSPPFSAQSYRETDKANRRENRHMMEAVFKRIESHVQPGDDA